MGDMGEIFNDWRAHKREAAQKRVEEAPQQIAMLEERGFTVRELSPHGPHLRIANAADYWPSTGAWRFLKERTKGHGFASLLRALDA
jgi:hypothetical protein